MSIKVNYIDEIIHCYRNKLNSYFISHSIRKMLIGLFYRKMLNDIILNFLMAHEKWETWFHIHFIWIFQTAFLYLYGQFRISPRQLYDHYGANDRNVIDCRIINWCLIYFIKCFGVTRIQPLPITLKMLDSICKTYCAET